MSEQVITADDYVQASFYVETLETLELEQNSTFNVTVPQNNTELNNITENGNGTINGTVNVTNATHSNASTSNVTVITKTVTTKTNITYCLHAVMQGQLKVCTFL